jgi:hypothetical protein
MKRNRRLVHVVGNGIEGWIPARRDWAGAVVVATVLLVLAAAGCAGWLLGIIHATEVLLP